MRIALDLWNFDHLGSSLTVLDLICWRTKWIKKLPTVVNDLDVCQGESISGVGLVDGDQIVDAGLGILLVEVLRLCVVLELFVHPVQRPDEAVDVAGKRRNLESENCFSAFDLSGQSPRFASRLAGRPVQARSISRKSFVASCLVSWEDS